MSVTIVRDPWHDSVFNLFIPLGNGNYARWQTFDDGVANYQALARVGVGKVYVGKVYPMHTTVGADDWTRTGTWTNFIVNGFTYHRTDTDGAAVKTIIAEGHNRIHLVAFPVVGGSGSITIDWDDGTTDGLDVTSYDLAADGSIVKDIVIATEAEADGTKALRITADPSSGGVRLCGLKSWNTDIPGDPAAQNGSGVWMGNDVVNVQGSASYNYYSNSIDSSFHLVSETPSALEGAVKWKPAGLSYKWSGGLPHLSDGNAKYTYFPSSRYLTDGPDVLVGGADFGGMMEMTMGSVISGDSISLVSEGFWDYDEDGTDGSGVDPKVTWTIVFDDFGMASSFAVQWRGAGDQVDTVYCPMIRIENRNGLEVSAGADGSEHPLTGSADVNLDGYNSARIRIPRIGYDLEMFSTLPGKQQWWLSSSDKLYLEAEVDSMLNNGSISQGDIWCFGGRWQFVKSNAGLAHPKSRIANYGRTGIFK